MKLSLEGRTALDVTHPASVADAFEQAAAAFGPVTVVVNNAGIAITKPLLEHTEDDWQQVIEVNLNGAWRVAQAGIAEYRAGLRADAAGRGRAGPARPSRTGRAGAARKPRTGASKTIPK